MTTQSERSPFPGSIDEYFNETYAHDRLHLGYWLKISALGFACAAGAAQLWFISYALSNTQFRSNILHDDLGNRGGFLAALAFLGKTTGALVAGFVGNDRGRRPQLLTSLGLIAVTSILCFFCPNVVVLATVQLFEGFGVGLSLPPLFTLATELSPPSSRGMFVTIVSSCWMVGAVYVAIVALVVLGEFRLSWRIFALCAALPSIIGLILTYAFIPESPRFLLLKGDYAAAAKSANAVARSYGYRGAQQLSECGLKEQQQNENTKSLDVAESVVDTTEESSLLATTTDSRGLLPVPEQCCHVNSSNQVDLFAANDPSVQHVNGVEAGRRSAAAKESRLMATTELRGLLAISKLYCLELRRITVPLQIASFCMYFCTYGILTWINTIFTEIHLKNIYFNSLLFAAAELPGDVITGAFVDARGRASLVMWSMILSAASLGIFAVFSMDAEKYAAGVVAGALAFQVVSVLGWNSLDCMTGEMFPTVVRTAGVGVTTAVGRAGAVVAQVVNGQLAKRPIVLLLVSMGNLLVGAVMAHILAENEMASRPLCDKIEGKDERLERRTTACN